MKTKVQKYISTISLAGFVLLNLLTPNTVLALGTDACTPLANQINTGGYNVGTTLPKYCTVESVYAKFITLALYFIVIVAVIMIIYGGYTYMTARGNAEQAKKGRQILIWAIAGLAVVLLAAVLVNIVVRALVENKFV